LQGEWARDMQALLVSSTQVEQAFHSINRLLNDPVDREIDVEEVGPNEGALEDLEYGRLRELLDDPSIRSALEDFLVVEALRNAPELNALDYNLTATDRAISLNGGQRFLPTVAAIGEYNRTFGTGGVGIPDPSIGIPVNNYNLGVSLSIPLFDSNLRNIDRQFARIQYDQLRLSREDATETIEQFVRDIVLDLVQETRNIELSGMAEEAAAEGLELTQAAYGSGAVNIVELLDSQGNLLRAQLARASAVYDFMSASMVLGRFVGHFFGLASDEENQTFFERFLAFRIDQAGGN
ncbi:MAG: TolC family protein, partial [Gemmatimonadetes bacterium]|nr:TolC family protein [Gemmatimonadota bacterium]